MHDSVPQAQQQTQRAQRLAAMLKRPSAAEAMQRLFGQQQSRRTIFGNGSPISVSSEHSNEECTTSRYNIQMHISKLERKVAEADEVLHVLLDKLADRETHSRRRRLEEWERRRRHLHAKHVLLKKTLKEGGDRLAKITEQGPGELFNPPTSLSKIQSICS